MEGVKFRAYNAATEQLAQLMGAVPTKIEAAELTQAFATGVADSMISSGSTGYDSKIWEHVKYWYDVQAWLPKNMVVVRSEEHTSELQSLMRISYAVFCLQKKKLITNSYDVKIS